MRRNTAITETMKSQRNARTFGESRAFRTALAAEPFFGIGETPFVHMDIIKPDPGPVFRG